MATKQEKIKEATGYLKDGECIYPDGVDYPCSQGCVMCYLKYIDSYVVIMGELPSVFDADENVMSALEYKKKLKFEPLVKK